MTREASIVAAINDRKKAMLAQLRTLVEHESPSHDKSALDELATKLLDRWQGLGATTERIANPNGGDHIIARFNDNSTTQRGLVVGHFDTVWPIGTLENMSFAIDSDIVRGPGVYDMKASFVMAVTAIEVLAALDLPLPRPITFLWTSDEEIGSVTSRALIETEARDVAYALVVEPPLGSGALKTARKGTGVLQLNVEGVAAHAGVEPEKGRSAITELAHQILAVNKLARPEVGTTINVGLISGGSAANVVPAHASATVDVRISTMAEATRIEAAMKQLTPVTPGVKLEVTGRIKRPPMERTAAVAELFERAKPLASRLGLNLTEGSTGGASDGNFTAAIGVATLDGLGSPGAGAHASHEHILVSGMLERTALLALLLLEL